ncbi:MAG TPA: methionyl-tRNA formyltransferase [Candidatus Dormibacteraeota bacterium]|nr:methionyl-tRNA formyltransferase [Candidatus Dormibacteraeota bacterium]
MRIVFCGTPAFAVPSLQHLLKQSDFEVLAVLTQPDRPRGRGQEVSQSAVKQAALAAGIAVHQPEKVRASEVQALLEGLKPDAIAIIAYGQIIPVRLLPIPKLGWINVHASLLPKYRGAAPINRAIANGETKTGVTTMRIDAGMDTGEMLLRREIEIAPAETAPELAARMAELGAPLLAETLRGIVAGTIQPQMQDGGAATYAPMLKKEDGRIDWNRPAREIYNRMRGFAPWPGAFTTFRGQICHVWGHLWGEPVSNTEREKPAAGLPGTLAHASGTLLVACGDATLLRLTSVKLEGRKEIAASEFANGARLANRERFGEA